MLVHLCMCLSYNRENVSYMLEIVVLPPKWKSFRYFGIIKSTPFISIQCLYSNFFMFCTCKFTHIFFSIYRSKVEINFDYTLNYDLDLPLIEHCSKFAEENKMNGTKGLIVFGTHHIGQEYLWLRIAMHLKESVWVNDEQRKLLTILADERVLNVLENDPAAAGIHIIQAYEIQEDVSSTNKFISFVLSHFCIDL